MLQQASTLLQINRDQLSGLSLSAKLKQASFVIPTLSPSLCPPPVSQGTVIELPMQPGTLFQDSDGDHIYVSEAGDTPLKVALRFNMPVQDLLEANRFWYLPDLQCNDSLRLCTQLHVQTQDELVVPPKTLWQVTGNQYIGCHIRRQFGSKVVTAEVGAYMPAGEGADEPEMWHVIHEDDDEEDVFRKELDIADEATEQMEEEMKEELPRDDDLERSDKGSTGSC